MQENEFIKRVMLLIGRRCTIFRNNTGTGWVGTRLESRPGTVLLKDARPLRAGLCEGGSDLIGWTTKVVTADMVGKPVAVFTAIELKAGRTRTSPEQANFIEQLRRAGGIAGIAYTPEEALNIIQNHNQTS